MKSQYMKTALITAAASLAFAAPALAEEDTTTFQVTATVNDSCTIEATDLAFGVYDPNTGDSDSTSTITATCTEGADYEIGLDAGSGTSGSTTRAMDDTTGNFLDYELYADSSRNDIWDEATTKDNPSATGGVNDHIVYGRIPGEQYVPAGEYSDIINVTITY